MARVNGLGFNNKLRRNVSVDGIEFEFEPTIGITAKKTLELANGFRSMRTPLEESVRFVMRPSISENFRVGGRPTWKALASSTIQKKKTNKILVESGKLSRVAQQRNIWTITRTVAVVNGQALVDRVKYAGYIQGGTQNMFARPYLVIQLEDEIKIEEIFLLWLEKRVSAVWGT